MTQSQSTLSYYSYQQGYSVLLSLYGEYSCWPKRINSHKSDHKLSISVTNCRKTNPKKPHKDSYDSTKGKYLHLPYSH